MTFAFPQAGRWLAPLLLVLAGCGSPPPEAVVGRLESPKQLDAMSYSASGLPAGFGDISPTAWEALSPGRYPVHGIDAARYQGVIDWRAARAAGVSFAWLKVTEGGDYLDPGWASNAPGARSAGVPVGGYHFYYFCRSPEEQAAWFIENVPKRSGDLPPMLDMEWNHLSPTCQRRPNPATVRAEILKFSDIVTAHYGTRPVVYTTPDFYEKNGLGALEGLEFWLRSVKEHPSERYPGERWAFWQYTGTGVVPGIGGPVDLNAFAGDRSAWNAWLALHSQN